jgi:hypothetical protein
LNQGIKCGNNSAEGTGNGNARFVNIFHKGKGGLKNIIGTKRIFLPSK